MVAIQVPEYFIINIFLSVYLCVINIAFETYKCPKNQQTQNHRLIIHQLPSLTRDSRKQRILLLYL